MILTLVLLVWAAVMASAWDLMEPPESEGFHFWGSVRRYLRKIVKDVGRHVAPA